jgi:hypothetical protein
VVRTVTRGTARNREGNEEQMSDEAFTDLKEALETALAFERGELLDLHVTRIRALRKEKTVTTATPRKITFTKIVLRSKVKKESWEIREISLGEESMPKVFLTKVWGFDPETYPALGFNSEGGRLKFLKESAPGDWVVLAGTRGAPTEPGDQGRLLGKVQLGSEEIDVEQVVRSIGTAIPDDHYNDDGRYRWPFGLPLIAAERFLDKPDLADVLGDYLPGTQWASYALDVGGTLGPDKQLKLETLRTEVAHIIDAPAIVRQRERQRALVLNQSRSLTGPGPSTVRSATIRVAGIASVYIFQLQGGPRTAYKIGYSGDLDGRLATLNKGLVTNVTGFSWRPVMSQKFSSEKQAYAFEQILHARLRQYTVEGEQEVYFMKRDDLNRMWTDVFKEADWAISEVKVVSGVAYGDALAVDQGILEMSDVDSSPE